MNRRNALLVCLVGIPIMLVNIPAVAEKFRWIENIETPMLDGIIPVSFQPKPSSHPLFLSVEQLNESKAKAPSFILSLREMLRNKEFEKLNTTLLKYEKLYEEDVSNEEIMFDAYSAFAINDTSYEALLNEWVKKYPENHQPYLIRAYFFHKNGWLSRGSAWAKDTSEEQFGLMGEYFLKALNDLEKALLIKQDHAVSYSLLINVYKSLGNSDAVWGIAKKGLGIAPYSFRIRVSYLQAVTPRWGGSYEEMERFSNEAQEYFSKNPRLTALRGYAYYDAGQIQLSAKNYGMAKDLFDMALSLGDAALFYAKRSRAFQHLKDYDSALADISRAIEMSPNESDYYYRQARILSDKKMIRESLDSIEIADQLSPNDKGTIGYKHWITGNFINTGYKKRKAGDLIGALEDYNLALRVNSDNGSSYYWRAQALVDSKDIASAYSDLKRSIQLDPDNYSAYRLMDWVLTQSSGWDEIIDYWGKYIALNPTSDKAYIERGGAYYRKGDVVSAVADAKRAADLGNIEGKRMYDLHKNKVD